MRKLEVAHNLSAGASEGETPHSQGASPGRNAGGSWRRLLFLTISRWNIHGRCHPRTPRRQSGTSGRFVVGSWSVEAAARVEVPIRSNRNFPSSNPLSRRAVMDHATRCLASTPRWPERTWQEIHLRRWPAGAIPDVCYGLLRKTVASIDRTTPPETACPTTNSFSSLGRVPARRWGCLCTRSSSQEPGATNLIPSKSREGGDCPRCALRLPGVRRLLAGCRGIISLRAFARWTSRGVLLYAPSQRHPLGSFDIAYVSPLCRVGDGGAGGGGIGGEFSATVLASLLEVFVR